MQVPVRRRRTANRPREADRRRSRRSRRGLPGPLGASASPRHWRDRNDGPAGRSRGVRELSGDRRDAQPGRNRDSGAPSVGSGTTTGTGSAGSCQTTGPRVGARPPWAACAAWLSPRSAGPAVGRMIGNRDRARGVDLGPWCRGRPTRGAPAGDALMIWSTPITNRTMPTPIIDRRMTQIRGFPRRPRGALSPNCLFQRGGGSFLLVHERVEDRSLRRAAVCVPARARCPGWRHSARGKEYSGSGAVC